MLTVDEVAIERAIALFLEVEKTVAEGAGAAGLAALLAYPQHFIGRKVGLVLSGGNIDTRLLASVLLRGLVRDGRIVRLRLMIGDLPGQLARVAGLIGKAGGNIVEVQHQRLFGAVVAKADRARRHGGDPRPRPCPRAGRGPVGGGFQGAGAGGRGRVNPPLSTHRSAV